MVISLLSRLVEWYMQRRKDQALRDYADRCASRCPDYLEPSEAP